MRHASHEFMKCSSCRLILETDPATIASRVAMRGTDENLSLTEQVTHLDLSFRHKVYLNSLLALSALAES